MLVVVADIPYLQFVLLWKVSGRFPGELLQKRSYFIRGRCPGYSRLELEKSAVGIRRRPGKVQWQIHVAVFPGEARRQHAQDGVGFVNQLDGFAHHGWIAVKVPLPEIVAENNHLLRLLTVRSIRGEKIAAKHCRQAEELETVGC